MGAAVPFAMKAAPWVASGVGALLGRKASQPSPLQQAAVTGSQESAKQLGAMAPSLMQEGAALRQQGTGSLQQGAGLLRQGAAELTPASNYYRTILGSRQAAAQAMSPETSTALEYYRGAEGKTRRTMRGGARDTALAELDRQKVGQIANYLPAARRTAAEGATTVGQAYAGMGATAGGMGGTSLSGGANLSGQGVNAAANSAYAQSGLFTQASQLRDQQAAGGKSWGSFLYDVLKSLPSGAGKVTQTPVGPLPQVPGPMMPQPPSTPPKR